MRLAPRSAVVLVLAGLLCSCGGGGPDDEDNDVQQEDALKNDRVPLARNAKDVRLAVDEDGVAHVRYIDKDGLRHVRARGAINAIVPNESKEQVHFDLKWGPGAGPAVKNVCGPYTG